MSECKHDFRGGSCCIYCGSVDDKPSTPEVDEQWKNICGYEGVYSVSNLGNVRRELNNGRNTISGRILVPAKSNKGYLRVSLSKDGVKKDYSIHVLVATAFIGVCPENHEVNHKDGIKTNNKLSNLEYLTGLENKKHAFSLGLVPRHWKKIKKVVLNG